MPFFRSLTFPCALAAALACGLARANPVTATELLTSTPVGVSASQGDGYLNNQVWLTFTVQGGTAFSVRANPDNAGVDPCIVLFAGDVNGLDFDRRRAGCFEASFGVPGLDVVGFSDDGGGGINGLASFLSGFATTTQTYSLAVFDTFNDNAPITVTANYTAVGTAVPLPGTLALAGLGLALVAGGRRRA